MTPEQFLKTVEGTFVYVDGNLFISDEFLHELMRLYGQHVAKEIRHEAAEIALTEEPEDAHRMIMNIQINDK